MFTGIIEECGRVKSLTISGSSGKIIIGAFKVLEGTNIGDSIAVNGVCLTVTDIGRNEFTADIMAETARRSSLSKLKPGESVNLERAMSANGRFGGHIVSGHIDGTGTIVSKIEEENAVWVQISTSSAILRLIVEKGSIAIDGISLTVAKVTQTTFSVSTIPHTRSATTLGERRPGDLVNLENDIVGKYVEKFICEKNTHGAIADKNEKKTHGITREKLMQYGY